jgi:transposase-like protein
MCREQDQQVGDISRRLGLVEFSLARWFRAISKELAAGFRSISIVTVEEG